MSDALDPAPSGHEPPQDAPPVRSPRRAAGRQRSIAVETDGLGLIKVRRVSLGGFARCADRLAAAGRSDDEALVDALIEEVVATGTGAGEPADPGRLARLTDTDRRSIAAAVLTLEGVKAAGEDVVQDPLVSLAERYGPMVGLGDRPRRPPVLLDDALDADPHEPGFNLPGEGAAVASAPEPQIPLFERTVLPPAPEHRLPGDPQPPAPSTRAARLAAEQSKAHFQELLDAQNQSLLALEGEHRALAAEAAALSERADRAERATRMQRWLAGGAVAIALLMLVVQSVTASRTERRLGESLQALQASLAKQEEAVKTLQAALAARSERAVAPRTPAPQRAPRDRARPAR